MKSYYVFLLVLLISTSNLYSQDSVGDEEEKDVNLFSFPVSPEAGRLGSYGNVPVNLSTGKMNFPISIYSLSAKGYSWPVSLSYNYNGLIYEGKPSIVGLGWNLQAGGVVTREVRGIPDEHPNGYYGAQEIRNRYLQPYFDSRTITRETANLLINGNIDGEADKYYVNVNGVSFSFKIGLNKQPIYLSEHNHKVILNWKNNIELDSFEVIDHSGIKYFFNVKEYNEPTNIGSNWQVFNDGFTSYVSSWNLNKVIFPNKEELLFTYNNDSYYSVDHFSSGASNTLRIKCQSNDYTPAATYNDGVSKTLIRRKILSQINSSSAKILFETPITTSSSNNGYRITYSSISILDKFSNNLIWRYNFNYEGARDLLMNITKNNEHYYSFDYANKNQIPAFINNENDNPFRQDLWGFYNGKTNTYGVNIAGSIYTSDKQISFAHTSAGAMNKIVYPTKGFTRVVYEQNTIKALYQETISDQSQEFTPNYQIQLELKASNQQGYKEKVYRYTFRDTTVARINYRIDAKSAAFAGVSMNKINGCQGPSFMTDDLGSYADHLRATTGSQIPAFCPLFHAVIDDGDIGGDPNSVISKSGTSNGFVKILPGTYEFKIWMKSKDIEEYGKIRLQFYLPPFSNVTSEGGEAPLFVDKKIGGIRIKQLINYSNEGKIATNKYFKYIDDEGFSSGLAVSPSLTYNYGIQHFCCTGQPGVNYFETFVRTNYSGKTFNPLSLGNGNTVFYDQVRETNKIGYKGKGTQGIGDCNTSNCLVPLSGDDSNGTLTYIGPVAENDLNRNFELYYPNGYTDHYFKGKFQTHTSSYPFVPRGEDKDLGRLDKQEVFGYKKDLDDNTLLQETKNSLSYSIKSSIKSKLS